MKVLSKSDKVIFLLIGLVSVLTLIFWKDVRSVTGSKTKTEKNKNEKGKKNEGKSKGGNQESTSTGISILKTWFLPGELKEVSGIAYLDNNRFACVQDEEGTIFIYNTASENIEKKIPFAGSGDYEGITVKGNTAFVVRADGLLFEIDMNAGKGSVKQYKTPLTAKHNIEGLGYDKTNNRLLLAIKDDEPGNKNYKGIYSFDLDKKQMVSAPAFKIYLEHEVLSANGSKKDKSVRPSALGIHPLTNEIYITDGPASRLLIIDKDGGIKNLIALGSEFEQPEGITFDPEGNMFISNEGVKNAGNITHIALP